MASSENRAEIIKQLLKLIDEIQDDYNHGHLGYQSVKIGLAKMLVEKLADPTKPDGDGQR